MNNDLMQTLQDDLLAARKAQDKPAVKTLQSVLSRITNAEAVPAPRTDGLPNPGVGSTEALRRNLTTADVQEIIHQELADMQNALAGLEAQPDHPYTIELKQELEVLSRY
jgi:hypothetical protein